MDLMWYLLLAHLVGDYALQSDRMAARKGTDRGLLTAHVTIYVTCIALILLLYSTLSPPLRWPVPSIVAALGVIFAIHWIQDYLKCRYFADSRQAYYADQVLHLAQLYALRLLVV